MPVRGIRGFTLIELLIVVAILAILLGLLFPVARAAKDQANRSTCMNNLRLVAQSAQAYHQEHGTYLPASGTHKADGSITGYAGARGIPDGGVTGLALAGNSLTRATMWCPVDPYPDRIGDRTVLRDETDSTYAFGYNYYGYVTASDGTPFPVTTEEAARYFFGVVDKDGGPVLTGDAGQDACSLGLVIQGDAAGNLYRPHGMFRGLWNYRAPADTVVTFCPHHTVGGSNALLVVTASGSAEVVKYAPPLNKHSGRALQGGNLERKPDPAMPALKPGIDWRANRGPYGMKDGHVTEDPNVIADAPTDARRMPIVIAQQVMFTADDLKRPENTHNGYGWYDTGIQVQEHDMVMVVAHAQWRWDGMDRFVDPAYTELLNQERKLWFSPEGDTVEARGGVPGGNMLRPDGPHNLLVGSLADVTQPFANDADRKAKVMAVGSRFSHLVPTGQTSTTLKLSLNDTANGYNDNVGWCEAWIAVYRPVDVNAQ